MTSLYSKSVTWGRRNSTRTPIQSTMRCPVSGSLLACLLASLPPNQLAHLQTGSYIAPEHAKLNLMAPHTPASPLWDNYSLGAVVLELHTGQKMPDRIIEHFKDQVPMAEINATHCGNFFTHLRIPYDGTLTGGVCVVCTLSY